MFVEGDYFGFFVLSPVGFYQSGGFGHQRLLRVEEVGRGGEEEEEGVGLDRLLGGGQAVA